MKELISTQVVEMSQPMKELISTQIVKGKRLLFVLYNCSTQVYLLKRRKRKNLVKCLSQVDESLCHDK